MLPTVPWFGALAAGLAAGMLSWLGGEMTYRAFPLKVELPPNYASLNTYQKQNAITEATRRARPPLETKRAAAAFGLLGAALGGILGLTGGLARRALGSGLIAAVFGVAVGLAAGAGASVALAPYFFRYHDPQSGLAVLLTTHGVIFAAVGAAGGLALGMGMGTGDRRSIGRGLAGGLLGALLGAFVFELVNALAFPLVRTIDPVPGEWAPRLLVNLCVAGFSAAVAAWAVGAPGKVTASASALD